MTSSATPGGRTGKPDTRPEPGPAPVGPAVRVPEQTPARTPTDPGPAPVGPAVETPPGTS
jgi:hypothetical protein